MALSPLRVLMYEGFAQSFPFGIGERESSSNKVPTEGGTSTGEQGCLEFTKGEVEAIAGAARAGKMIAVAPQIRVAKIITCATEASNAETARFIKSALGGGGGADTKIVCVKGAEWKEETVV